MQYVYMNIHVHIEDGILDVVNGSLSSSIGSWIIYRSNFSVRALDVGTTTLYVSLILMEFSCSFLNKL